CGDDARDDHGVPSFRRWDGTRSTPRLFPVSSPATRSYRASVRLDHVVIAVSDFERSNAFYRDVLGAEVVDIDGRVAYRIGGQQLNVHGPGVRPAMVARVPVSPGSSDLCFEWDDAIDGAIRHLQAHGVHIEAGPMTRGGAKG